jgi:hypothetical protein
MSKINNVRIIKLVLGRLNSSQRFRNHFLTILECYDEKFDFQQSQTMQYSQVSYSALNSIAGFTLNYALKYTRNLANFRKFARLYHSIIKSFGDLII